MNILRAILNIRPGSCFQVNGDTYEGLVWQEPPVWEGGQKKPTKEEFEAAIERLQQEWENTEYQRLRAKGDTEQIQAYIDACLAVKAKYPKPEGVE